MKLLIALVNYNTTELLSACLRSALQQELPFDYRIVVVDNNSQDGGAQRLREAFPQVSVIANAANLGYAKAVNKAILACQSEYVLLLNPDIQVLPGSIQSLVDFLDGHQDVGIAGAKLLNPDGTLQYSCRTFYTLPTIVMRRTLLGKLFPRSRILARHLMSDWDHASVRDVDWMLGACMLIRRSALRDVGLMDEHFFLYFEDVDWCYRMRKGGWRVTYVPHAQMLHHHRRESTRGVFSAAWGFHLISMVRFYDKWGQLLYMLRRHPVFGVLLVVAADLIAVNLSLIGAHLLRGYLSPVVGKPHTSFANYQDFLVFANVVTVVVFFSLRLYAFSRGALWVDELFRIAKGVFVSSLVLMAGTFLAKGLELSRLMIVIFALLCMVSMFAFRWGGIALNRELRKRGFNLRRTFIVGTGATALSVFRELRKHPELGFEIIGFIRDPREIVTPDAQEALPVIGTADRLGQLVHEHHANELIIATGADSRELISQCKKDGVHIHLVTDLFSLSMHETLFEELAGIPMIFFKGTPLLGFNTTLKRGVDIGVACLSLVLLSPIMLAIALAIRLDSPGPALFEQQRVGIARKPFRCYKFRSMCRDAETMTPQLREHNQATGPLFKMRHDPRLTRVGRFLRRYSLDELPQLYNVLIGDMSLVGPRPALPAEVAQYDEVALKRLDIRPGLTGLWQVSGRSNLTFAEMVQLDIYYIWNWSLPNDLKILLRTLPVVISGKGAY